MPPRLRRREVLRGIAAGAVTLSVVGPVTAAGAARYVVTVRGRGVVARLERAGFTVVRELAGGRVLLVEGTGDAEAIERTKGVSAVARDYRFRWDGPVRTETAEEKTTDDAFYPLQWDKQVTDVPEAHETATGAGTTIAVIDTGVDVDDHPDLLNVDRTQGRLFRNGDIREGRGEVEFPATPEDSETSTPTTCAGTTTFDDHVADDVYFHGTHVAGIAGATRDETTGVVGTAPDTTIVPLRVFWWTTGSADCDDDGDDEEEVAVLLTTIGDILTAIDHAAEIGVDAMNMSIGTPPLPPRINAIGIRAAYERVIQRATRQGSVVVVSAGNADANLQQGGYFTLPNSTAGAMSIGATGPNDERTFYSNFGTNEIDVGAPGGGYETLAKTLTADYDGDGSCEYPIGDVDGDGETEYKDRECPEWPYPTNLVWSTCDPDSYVGQVEGGVQYIYAAGTSMAAPQVTGTAALVREVAPEATPRQVEQAIERGADDVTGKNDPELGAGRLNAAGALNAVRR